MKLPGEEITQLKQKIEDLKKELSPELQYPTYESGIKDIGSDCKTYFEKIGNRVFININAIVPTTANVEKTLFVLPAQYRPKKRTYSVCIRK